MDPGILNDTFIHIEEDGSLWTSLYSKPTDSHNYIHYDSAHPMHIKCSLPYSQFPRIICSRVTDFIEESMKLLGHFLCRGYPLPALIKAFDNVKQQDRLDLLKPKNG